MKATRVLTFAILFSAVIGWFGFVDATAAEGPGKTENQSVQDDTMQWEQPRHELSPERIEQMLERIKKVDPETAQRLAELQKKDPNEFKKQLQQYTRSHRTELFGDTDSRVGRERRGDKEEAGMTDANSERGQRGGDKDDRWGREGGGRMRKRMQDMQNKHEEYLRWLKENYPEEAAELEGVRQNDPAVYMKRLMESGRKYGKVAWAAKENPELAAVLKEDIKLKEQRDAILEKMAAAKPEEKEALTAQLREIVVKRFDLIVQRKQIQHKKLLEKLEDLKKQVEHSQAEADKWKASKDERVEARMKELLEQTEKFHWD